MIWYFLYPFRGTTEPPQLGPDHPIRRAFVNHGTRTAQHWLLSLLLSVGVGVLFCYPAFFLHGPSTSNTHSLPHHVWTSAKLYDGDPNIQPDLEMRPIWIHGSYMKALEPEVFRDALEIQHAMIGLGFGHGLSRTAAEEATATSDTNSSANKEALSAPQHPCTSPPRPGQSWGFHSPLMYWNCSLSSVNSHEQLVNVINEESSRYSPWNISLRPSSVLAGKSFVRSRVVAADALVVTFFDRSGLALGQEWDSRTKALFQKNQERWSFYPHQGKTRQSELYEFLFQPMSLNDDFLLSMAYFSMALYVVLSLRKIRAVKSKLGLLFTVLVEMAVSILASLTICGILKINLSRIPREIHPFVVLVIGLENRFRLINAVLAYPPQMQTVDRIANALGDVGHQSLATAGQVLVALWLLSRVVWPDVAALCSFAAVALVFDFLFHLTFFTAVLSVDVRRMELQDSLDKVNLRQVKTHSHHTGRRSWVDAMKTGHLPFSTRIAGSAAAISFVLTLNLHFFNGDSLLQTAWEILRFQRSMTRDAPTEASIQSPPINQARTLSAWLQMQDHDTAKEIIQFVNPSAHSFIARVYEPLTIVLKGSNRTDDAFQHPSVFGILLDLAQKHFFPFALVVIFIIALVTLLMNYLLWEDVSSKHEKTNSRDHMLTIRSLANSHSLDVVKLASSVRGHFTSISLERSIVIWLLDSNTNSYSNTILRTIGHHQSLWPIAATAVDEATNLIGFCTDVGRIAFWSIPDRRFVKFCSANLSGHTPTKMVFATMPSGEPNLPSLLLLTPDGQLTIVDYSTLQIATYVIHQGAAISAALITNSKDEPCLVSAFRDGELFVSHFSQEQWRSKPITQAMSPKDATISPVKPRLLLAAQPIGIFGVVSTADLVLMDVDKCEIVKRIKLRSLKPSSVRVLHSQRRQCSCGGPAVRSLSIVYTPAENHNCVMITYTSNSSNLPICMKPLSEALATCQRFDTADMSVHTVENAGTWDVTHAESVIGIRRTSATRQSQMVTTAVGTGLTPLNLSQGQSSAGLRKRGPKVPLSSSYASVTSQDQVDAAADWQIWSLSLLGEFISRDLASCTPFESTVNGNLDREPLFVTKPGPIGRLGRRSVVFAMGNSLKVVTTSHERFEATANGFDDPAASISWRKKPPKKTI